MSALPVMPHILIVDDEAPARARLTDLLTDLYPSFPHVIHGEAKTGRECMEYINASLDKPNPISIVLMDIQMPGMSGLEAAQHIARLPVQQAPSVIFCTAFDQHALQAFEVNAVDYLLKPVRDDRLLAALRKARKPAGGHASFDSLNPKARANLSAIERGRVLTCCI
jgi:two-component system, LytTR family, response regulator AlgR